MDKRLEEWMGRAGLSQFKEQSGSFKVKQTIEIVRKIVEEEKRKIVEEEKEREGATPWVSEYATGWWRACNAILTKLK